MQEAPDLDDDIRRHLQHLRVERRLAERTLVMYGDAFKWLQSFAAAMPVPFSYGRCGSWLPNQKQNGLSAGTVLRNSAKLLKVGPAGFRSRPPALKFPGPQPFPVKPTT